MTLQTSRRKEFIRRKRATQSAPITVCCQPTAHLAGPALEGICIHTPFTVGKYLVSPLTRPLVGGRHAAAVSIRSGAGSMTHDRVMRFVPDFATPDQATRFAAEQALAWIARPMPEPAFHPITPD